MASSSAPKDYSRVVKGKLSFKGDSSKKLKKKRSISQISSTADGKDHNADSTTGESGSSSGSSSSAKEEPEIKICTGIGRITSSGITVQGHFTEFMNQLSPGDAIIITHPTSLIEETKIVRMVLSNSSIGISSSFSTDLISTTPFRYINAPKDEVSEAQIKAKEVSKKHKSEEDAFGTYASKGGQELVYRVKSESAFGGYKIVREKNLGGEKSREELLDLRAKKKSDRYCY